MPRDCGHLLRHWKVLSRKVTGPLYILDKSLRLPSGRWCGQRQAWKQRAQPGGYCGAPSKKGHGVYTEPVAPRTEWRKGADEMGGRNQLALGTHCAYVCARVCAPGESRVTARQVPREMTLTKGLRSPQGAAGGEGRGGRGAGQQEEKIGALGRNKPERPGGGKEAPPPPRPRPRLHLLRLFPPTPNRSSSSRAERGGI